MMYPSPLTALLLSCTLAHSKFLPVRQSTTNPYAPLTTTCPSGSLIRTADSLNPDEEAYVEQRSRKAAEALSEWLGTVWGDSFTAPSELPRLALALSGGGPKAGLITAGAVYALDGREDDDSAGKGLLQSMIYVSALSGGSLTLAGIMANDFAQVSTLRSELYENYQNPYNLALSERDPIIADVRAKAFAGYPTSLLDLYARVLAYNYISLESSGGNGLLWSNVTRQPSFLDFDAPYPFITITQADVAADMCLPSMTSPIWEVAPLEFGSWDDAVAAFYPTQYLGTQESDESGQCTIGFDNTGFISGISANILPTEDDCTTGNYSDSSLSTLAGTIDSAYGDAVTANPYAIISNPFYQSADAGVVRDLENLYGTDGGYSGQGIPIFPFIQPERDIDVIVVIDAESSDVNNITDGESIYNTYTSAQMKGLSKMPAVPTVAQFTSQNFSASPHFYGCYDTNLTTLIFLPDTDATNVTSSEFFYSPEQVNSTIQSGINMVTQRGDDAWPACLACGIMHKTNAQLPDGCTDCLNRYCWNASSTENPSNGSAPSPSSTSSPSSSSSPSSTPDTGSASIVRSSMFSILAGVVVAAFI